MEPITPAAPPPTPPADIPIAPASPDLPPATPAPLVPATPPIQQFNDGGQPGKGNAVSRWVENVSFTEVGMLIITSCVIFLVADYYRKRIKYLREEETRMSNKMDELTANVQSFVGPAYKSFS